MPSYLHELLLLLFRNRSQAAAEVLRSLDVQLPEYEEVCIEASDLNHLAPAEYRADLVLLLMRGTQKEMGIIVEVQLQTDEDKRYAWPAYAVNLRARHRCPVCLLVVTVEEYVARWAAEPIPLGASNYFTPRVIGPSNTAPVTEARIAEENVELAVLSAIEHARHVNAEFAARVASTAILASAGVDAERSRLYIDAILIALSENAGQALRSMNSLGFEYQSDFARKYVAQGRGDIVLRQLTRRFGPLSEEIRARVRAAAASQLDAVADEVLTAPTLEDAVRPLS